MSCNEFQKVYCRKKEEIQVSTCDPQRKIKKKDELYLEVIQKKLIEKDL